jgi:hypothetical protein
MADFTCALDIGIRYSIGCKGNEPAIFKGAVPCGDAPNRAPISERGSIMRLIGLVRREASPVIVLEKGWPARTPDRRRIVVPELPASKTVFGI